MSGKGIGDRPDLSGSLLDLVERHPLASVSLAFLAGSALAIALPRRPSLRPPGPLARRIRALVEEGAERAKEMVQIAGQAVMSGAIAALDDGFDDPDADRAANDTVYRGDME